MNIKTLLMLLAILNMGALYSSDNLLIARGEGGHGGGMEFRGGGSGDRFRGGDENRGVRDAAALDAAHRSGEESGFNQGVDANEGFYAPPAEYFPCGGINQNQQGNSGN